jgi:hypothetical protein
MAVRTAPRRKVLPPYRVEVSQRHGGAAPFGWVLYRRGHRDPIDQSTHGFALEADAWSDGGRVMDAWRRGKAK